MQGLVHLESGGEVVAESLTGFHDISRNARLWEDRDHPRATFAGLAENRMKTSKSTRNLTMEGIEGDHLTLHLPEVSVGIARRRQGNERKIRQTVHMEGKPWLPATHLIPERSAAPDQGHERFFSIYFQGGLCWLLPINPETACYHRVSRSILN